MALAVVRSRSLDGLEAPAVHVEVQLANGLRKLSTQHGLGEVRGNGLLLGLALPAGNGDAIAEAAREQGLLINAARPDTLRFMPALNVSADEVDTCLAMLDQLFAQQAA